ncbi:MAG TPA: PIG-L family deacetylase [Candidatus Dormibacteraeota bacterium]|nr:PIG-L family deacetylase [Candidatus Dormibacteraeota bacterium]
MFLATFALASPPPQKLLAQPDDRYKADILVVVAHPDDEGAATPYLARAIDEGKRVAVVYGTSGGNGGNEVGSEQASALGEVRQIEARKANASLGITNVWFLSGKDTASQNVLQSLANWGHGECLEQLVRLVRLTRPEVILTFLPGTFIGEDHGDHQAAGVLATEAFDLAGDPTVFPEQVAGPTRRLETFLENLRPWQTKKIYYFPDATREDIFRGLGPEYSVKEISKSTKLPYWRMAMNSFLMHQTQAKGYIDALSKMSEADIEKQVSSQWGEAQHFVRGKSLVGGSITGDIFEGVTSTEIPFMPVERMAEPNSGEGISVELAGTWGFYAAFRRAHALQLPHPEPPEIALQYGTVLVIPLWVHNPSAKAQQISLNANLPAGWTASSGTGDVTVGAQQTAATRIEINLPAAPDAKAASEPAKKESQEVSVTAESNGKPVGTIRLRVELRKRALPE